jgi:hypothetical protein
VLSRIADYKITDLAALLPWNRNSACRTPDAALALSGLVVAAPTQAFTIARTAPSTKTCSCYGLSAMDIAGRSPNAHSSGAMQSNGLGRSKAEIEADARNERATVIDDDDD